MTPDCADCIYVNRMSTDFFTPSTGERSTIVHDQCARARADAAAHKVTLCDTLRAPGGWCEPEGLFFRKRKNDET